MTSPVSQHRAGHTAVFGRLQNLVRRSGRSLEDFELRDPGDLRCPVLDFAASGAMWLTGEADGPPVAPDAPVMSHLRALRDGMSSLTERVGKPVKIDVRQVVSGRAGFRGFRRQGSTSANGSCRLIPARDGWLAVSLPRPGDLELLPAAIGSPTARDPWEVVVRAARGLPTEVLVERAQLVGIAAAQLPTSDASTAAAAPFRMVRLGSETQYHKGDPLVVVDFSALWAGPLCAHILGATGATVIKVEDPSRPDGARTGDPYLFGMLHTGHQVVRVPFATDAGVRNIHQLVEAADVLVESSRPRALAQLGLSPQGFLSERPGRTWVSITGYGRSGARSNYVAFGDDAAVSGGLVGWSSSEPVFCGDAVADPLSGLFAAMGALSSITVGGGRLVDVSMNEASAFVCNSLGCMAPHDVERDASGQWFVHHASQRERIVAPSEIFA